MAVAAVRAAIGVVRNLTSGFADFFASRVCESCGTFLGNSDRRLEFICDKCFDSMPLAPPPEVITNKLITFFPGDELYISRAIALFSVFEDTQFMDLIHSLKYRGFRRVGREFGRLLAKMLQDENFTGYDFLIPVPIHPARSRERGYNQSEAIAEGISEILHIPVNKKIIRRAKYTITQTMLSAKQRKTNLLKSISPDIDAESARGGRLLLIDDVITTGSTLNTCAGELLNIGARKVDCAALASAYS